MEKKASIDDYEARQPRAAALAARHPDKPVSQERKKTMASNRNLLLLPGDGIGPEVMAEVKR
jgi:hypothetical protein